MKCLNPNCNNEFKPRGTYKKFCCTKCNHQYNALKYYQEHKDDPQFKQKVQQKFNVWRAKNKEKHNEAMRLIMGNKIKTEKYRAQRKEYESRPEVQERNREKSRRYYWKMKEMGGAI